MALVTVVFLMIVLGIMEFGSAFMVTQAMVSAAREGARRAAVVTDLQPNDPRVEAQCQGRLTSAGIRNGVCSNTMPQGQFDMVTVEVVLNYQSVTGVERWFRGLNGLRLVRQCGMRREN
jgi:Flp pilus assembly protein TadG